MVRWNWSRRTIPGYIGRPGRESETVECAALMGRSGLTWPLRAARFTPSALPAASVFSARGYVIQAPEGDLLWLLAITSSLAFDFIFKVCLGRAGHPEYIVGILQKLPMPLPSDSERSTLSSLARRAWALKRQLDGATEYSHAFKLPRPLLSRVMGLDSAAIETEITRITAEINDIAFRLYGLNGEDRDAIETWGLRDGEESIGVTDTYVEPDEAPDDEDETTGLENDADDVVSWAVGVAFGRFDVRLATRERAIRPNRTHSSRCRPKAPAWCRTVIRRSYPATASSWMI
jgi:hypothetical protein